MPARKDRNAAFRHRASPGGKQSKKRKSDKPSKARCGLCKGALGGVPHRSPSALAKLAKTQKRPERPFGGVLCSGCLSQVIRDKVRLQQGLISKEDVDFRRLKFITGLKKTAQ
jgi:large subunit ribosomal protein L34e